MSMSKETVETRWQAIPHMPIGTVPDDIPEKNRLLHCRIIAKRALLATYEEADEEPETAIQDMLADLRHLCDALHLDFARLDQKAYDNYSYERAR